ncbi:Protein SEY1 [Galdieria sulphuraria]|uniref:Protein SEY1 homolog n=1 Tax=Galdieria sulphuraria TaxID=130081 RepID=M2XWG7_GALSU|nr:GTP-binding protein [Galdieria sulphuraria]EME27774.1 GTP-binding protein [Galdieria sulphuraria]GJD10189.1 Protein SEY1 [Galdieria sulphuraria]|eukprot:XP_005704294.1 GTP-binding protein [Galdieria sulphuraria]
MARVQSLTTEDYRQNLENGFIQMVNYEEEFNSQVSQFVRDVGLYNADLDYHVVAVMGCQSSGKSTLLNLLFGTQFRTMDANTGRYQVTQGIWLSKDKDFPILVLDLEGTDSRERGEEAASFERKSTLFALAVADVLIVNMWAQDVGRYVAANLALLRTVLELNLQLFQNDREHRKTKLLFVLRDHVETSLDLLAKTIRTDLEETWKNLQKPSQFENSTVENFFELKFVSLPHMVLKTEEFKAAVTNLRNQFHIKGNSPDSMFPESYRRLVAADGFTTYANNIWETIRSNKEVDIPSQREMLATVRCEEIAEEVYLNIHHKFQNWNETFDMLKRNSKGNFEDLYEKLIDDLGDQIWQIMMEAIEAYNNGTKRYISSVSEAKKVKLQERIEAEGKELFLRQLSLVEEHGLLFLEKELEHLASRTKPWIDFQTQVCHLLEKFWKTFRNIASCSLGEAKLLFKEVIQSKEEEFEQREQKMVERFRRSVVDKTIQVCVEKTGSQFRNLFITTLENNPQDIWLSLNRPLSSIISESLKELAICLNEICLDEDRRMSILKNVLTRFEEEIELRVKDLLSSNSVTMSYLYRKFDNCFRKDSRGVPRVWKPGDDLDSLYLDAKRETQSLLITLSEAKLTISLENLRNEVAIENLSDLMHDSEIVFEIFSVERRNTLEEKLEDYAKLAYTEAKRSQETIHTRSQIPSWLYIALFVLGFNEMKMVLRNPLLLLSVLLILPVLYVLVQANLHSMLFSMVLSKMEQYLPVLQGRMHSVTSTETISSGVNLQSSFDSPIPNRVTGNGTAKTTGIRLRKPNHFSQETVSRRRRNSAGSE